MWQLPFRPPSRHGQPRLPGPAAAEPSLLPALPAPPPSWPSPQRPSVARPRWRPSWRRPPGPWPLLRRGPFPPPPSLPSLGQAPFQRLRLCLLADNGFLGQAGFLGGCRHLTPDPGSRCLMGGCSRETGRDGRHGRGVEGHASAPICGLLLGDADGALHGCVLMRGPLPGNPKVAGHPSGVLTGARHVPLVGSDAAAGAGLVGRHPPAVG